MAGWLDNAIIEADRALRTISGVGAAMRPTPQPVQRTAQGDVDDRAAVLPLTGAERRHAAGLMRVNHVGEVCAQALYSAQARATSNEALRHELAAAAREEADHLAWTSQRLGELDARPSLLNPLWYAGAYALGWMAGKAGDAVSLGFVVETERQVEQHLESHLEKLPMTDAASRAIVDQMRADEVRHGQHAQEQGAAPLPLPVQGVMRAAAKIMTTTAYWI